MPGRDRHRIAEPEGIGLADLAQHGTALGLVGDEDDRFADAPQPLGEMLVGRGHPLPRVDDQERDVGLVEGALGLRPHPADEAVGRRLLEPGGVDQIARDIGDAPPALAAVAGHPGQIVDQGTGARPAG